jgi:NADPH:quinone reductase-like Zn-dependent oxidoreductase
LHRFGRSDDYGICQGVKPGGKLISISCPLDPGFAEEIRATWFVKLIMRLLSAGVRKKAKRLNVSFSFIFMRAQGSQLSPITSLIDAGIIRPVMDKVFPFEQTNKAVAYVETGRAKGKVVIKIKIFAILHLMG